MFVIIDITLTYIIFESIILLIYEETRLFDWATDAGKLNNLKNTLVEFAKIAPLSSYIKAESVEAIAKVAATLILVGAVALNAVRWGWSVV